MSQYADYRDSSGSYDTTRIPIGVDTILAYFDAGVVPLDAQSILAAGCGTGNYLEALRPHLGAVSGIDFSESMLAQARMKLGSEVDLTCGSILQMPFEDQQFDGITCNQVLHHLDEGPTVADDPAAWNSSSFPHVRQFVQEAFRILRPGGAVVINSTSHEQLRDGFWWAELIPTAVDRLSCRMPDIDQLSEILSEAGFGSQTVSVDLDGVLQGPSYLDPQGPLDAAWRAGDSTWSLTTDTELASARQRVERMNAEGSMQAYFDHRERKRSSIGQTTFIRGRK